KLTCYGSRRVLAVMETPSPRRPPPNPASRTSSWGTCRGFPGCICIIHFSRPKSGTTSWSAFIWPQRVKALHEVVPDFGREKWIMQMHPGNPRQVPQDDVLDAGLGGGRRGDGVSI